MQGTSRKEHVGDAGGLGLTEGTLEVVAPEQKGEAELSVRMAAVSSPK